MTSNQIAYWELQNKKAQLAETARANKEQEKIKWSSDDLNWKMAPYEAAVKVREVSKSQAEQFQNVTKGLANIAKAAMPFLGLFGS